MAQSWCKVSAQLDSNPKVRRAGNLGRQVFEFALRRNAELDAGGVIPRSHMDPWYLADVLMMSGQSDAESGLSRAVQAGLLVETETGYAISGWDDDWGKKPLTEAQRKRIQRAKSRNDAPSQKCPDINGTKPDGPECHAREEKRKEEKRESSLPRAIPQSVPEPPQALAVMAAPDLGAMAVTPAEFSVELAARAADPAPDLSKTAPASAGTPEEHPIPPGESAWHRKRRWWDAMLDADRKIRAAGIEPNAPSLPKNFAGENELNMNRCERQLIDGGATASEVDEKMLHIVAVAETEAIAKGNRKYFLPALIWDPKRAIRSADTPLSAVADRGARGSKTGDGWKPRAPPAPKRFASTADEPDLTPDPRTA